MLYYTVTKHFSTSPKHQRFNIYLTTPMRTFLSKMSVMEGDVPISHIIQKAIVDYGKDTHKLSYYEHARAYKVESRDELSDLLMHERARNRSLTTTNQRLLKQLGGKT